MAAALWPSWLREAFADEGACEGQGGALARLAVLSGAFRRARDAGKPLLVLVIPDNDMDKWQRGRAFGELLNHGSDVQLAPLSRVEVTCATMAELKKLVPSAGMGEPLMVLVSTDRVPVTARHLDAKLLDYPSPWGDGTESWEERGKKEDAIGDKRIAVMAGLLRDTLGADDKNAAALALEVRKRLTKQPPNGAKWATSYGCGTEIEGEKQTMMVACGMGHVPKKSARFLYFFTRRVL
ncbi:Hypothetical protein A7982_00720 [Minicystis rosea]|nr:Hypothetical protein A7982_00720 [Minicystis rosea]